MAQKLNGNSCTFFAWLRKNHSQAFVKKNSHLWKIMHDDEKRFWRSEKSDWKFINMDH
jgi:hypothetical protein